MFLLISLQWPLEKWVPEIHKLLRDINKSIQLLVCMFAEGCKEYLTQSEIVHQHQAIDSSQSVDP